MNRITARTVTLLRFPILMCRPTSSTRWTSTDYSTDSLNNKILLPSVAGTNI